MGSHGSDERTALLGRHATPPSWTGDSITHLALYRRAPLYFRVDALPFVFQYSALFSVWYSGLITRLTALTLLATIVTFHILAFLLQHWSLRAKALMSLSRVQCISKALFDKEPVFVLAVPRLHRGRPELVPLEISDQDVLFFNFQKRKYVYSDATNTFEKILYPTELPISEYISAASLRKNVDSRCRRKTI